MLTLKSLNELRAFGVGPVIQIQHAGAFYKARYAGNASFVFGTSPTQARERLLQHPWKCLNNSPRKSRFRKRKGAK